MVSRRFLTWIFQVLSKVSIGSLYFILFFFLHSPRLPISENFTMLHSRVYTGVPRLPCSDRDSSESAAHRLAERVFFSLFIFFFATRLLHDGFYAGPESIMTRIRLRDFLPCYKPTVSASRSPHV